MCDQRAPPLPAHSVTLPPAECGGRNTHRLALCYSPEQSGFVKRHPKDTEVWASGCHCRLPSAASHVQQERGGWCKGTEPEEMGRQPDANTSVCCGSRSP